MKNPFHKESKSNQPETFIGYKVGYRTWKVMEPTGHLVSPSQNFLWEPKNATFDHSKHGVYAFKEPRMEYDGLFGKVALWGKVHVHKNGFKGQFAYPLVLFYRDEGELVRAKRSADLYGVEVELCPEMALSNADTIFGLPLPPPGTLQPFMPNPQMQQLQHHTNQLAGQQMQQMQQDINRQAQTAARIFKRGLRGLI